MPLFRPSFVAWARTLPDGEVYRLDPNGPKPRKIGGVIWNSKARPRRCVGLLGCTTPTG